MCVTQDVNSFGEIIAHVHCSVDEKNIYIQKMYIQCVPHKQKKIGSHDMKQTDYSIIIVRNVWVLTSASMIVYLFFTGSWSAMKSANPCACLSSSPLLWRLINFRLFCSDDCRSWPRVNNHCQECVRAYLSINDCLSFLHEVMIGNHRTKTFLHEVMIGNHRNKTSESWSVSTIMARTIKMHYFTGKQNYLLSNILRFALKICFWADF
jgi:hypothetical protein